jgi:hypothetical protein
LLTALPALALERVSWNQLPYYLASRGITLNQQLPLCDCPAGLRLESPSHHIIQVIANSLYEWREYEFSDDRGNPVLALYLIEPREQPLTAAEARVLLTASAGWQQSQTAIPIRSAANTSEFLASFETRGIIESASLRGDENRAPVPADLIVKPIYNTIANLVLKDGNSQYRGTGFMVSPTVS